MKYNEYEIQILLKSATGNSLLEVFKKLQHLLLTGLEKRVFNHLCFGKPLEMFTKHLSFDLANLFLRICPIGRKVLPEIGAYVQGCHSSVFHKENNWKQTHSCQWGMVAQWNITQLGEHLHLCVYGYL